MALANALQLEAALRHASRTALFWPKLYCAYTETATSEISAKKRFLRFFARHVFTFLTFFLIFPTFLQINININKF